VILNFSRRLVARLLLSGVCAVFLICVIRVMAQQKQAPTPSKPAPHPPGRVWVSETSGKEFLLWKASQQWHAEWVNVPSELAERGASIKTMFRRQGSKWVGTAQSYLPCTLGEGAQEHIANWCHVQTGMEISSMTDERITGRGEALERFDCQKCQVLEKAWRNFVWVPKKEKK